MTAAEPVDGGSDDSVATRADLARRARRVEALADRELTSVLRTRTYALLAVGYGAVVLGLAWAAGPSGLVTLALDLLTPVEVLVPALAIAFGYRALAVDAEHGELDVVRTFDCSRGTTVLGVFLGRAGPLLVVVLAPLVLAMVLPAILGGPSSSVIATGPRADPLVLYGRFLALTAAYALAALAAAVAVSTVVSNGRSALVLGVGLLVALVVGLDLGVVGALAVGLVGDAGLGWLLAASPASAYRGLVLATVVQPATDTGGPLANPLVGALGLLIWLVAGLLVARATVWR